MKPILKPILVMMGVVLCSFSFTNVYAQSKVVIPGTFQSELGCPGDWLPDCDNTALTFNSSTGLWTGTFNIPQGCYQYKVAIDGSWDINYGEHGLYGANLSLYVPQDALVTFSFDPQTGIVQTTPFSSGFSEYCLPLVVLAGDFQNELGCTNDWDASCTNTELIYTPATGQFENIFDLPQGFYQFRTILNNDWVGTSYGSDGLPGGSDYFYYSACQQKVRFSYDPLTHIVSFYELARPAPDVVVIAGSFQSELGCPGDWLPDCDKTGMHLNALYGIWTDTLELPAGHWEYKITINNSWDENYGLYGEPGGPNISIDLCYPAKVAFEYIEFGCYRSISSQVIINGVCVNNFYDANVNGYPDPGEEPISGVTFTLTGDGVSEMQKTDIDGKATFTNLPDGIYTIKERIPPGYLPSPYNPQTLYLYSRGESVNFGNTCLGPGGAKDKGFWISKTGEAALMNSGQTEYALSELRALYLRNEDGSDFDPVTYDQFRVWLKASNAKNISYMLSSEMATIYLSRLLGYVANESIVFAAPCQSGDNGIFLYGYNIIIQANYFLSYIAISTGNEPNRAYLACLTEALANANNNLNFVQPHPCRGSARAAVNKTEEAREATSVAREVKVSPNPSTTYFTLRPSNKENNKSVELKVFNIYGQQVYRANGSSTRDYRFGENFTPGIYLAEITQGKNKTTLKLVKQ